MLPYKPHTGRYFAPDINQSGGIRTASTRTDGMAITGQMSAEGASESFAAANMEAQNPRRLLVDFEPGMKMKPGGDIVIDQFPGVLFRVVAKPIPWNQIGMLSCCEILCEQLDHTSV